MRINCFGLENAEDRAPLEIEDDGIILGSDEGNGIVFDTPGVSGRHARLFQADGKLFLEDLKSLNGTYLNEKRIENVVEVKAGDRIRIGVRQIRLESAEPSGEGEAPTEFNAFFEQPEIPVYREECDPDSLPPEAEESEEYSTAMTVMADAGVKELIRSGNFEALQQESSVASLPSALTTSVQTILCEGKRIGKYTIVKKIGKGGMGVIFLARHETLNVYRALKVLPREICEENNLFFERFLREARIASEIHHPNVVGVMDVETDAEYGISYIVMEYIDGGSLRRILKSQKKLSEAQAIVIVQGIAAALSAAAEHKIVHRDIKPDNIMFTRRGEVKLADLGIAKNDNDDVNLTKTNIMIGTPAYLSPEQVENPRNVDIRSDLYSLGATFYEMVTGQHPYVGSSTYDVLHKLFSEPVPNPRDKNPEISEGSAEIIMKMLDKEPDKRFQTPEELLEALETCLPQYTSSDAQNLIKSAIAGVAPEHGPSTLMTSNLTRRNWKTGRKRLRPFAGIAVAAGLGIGGMLYVVMKWGPEFFQLLESRPAASLPSRPVHPSPETPRSVSLAVETEPDTEVHLISSNGIVTTYLADESGHLSIRELSPGRYSIRAQHRGRKNYSMSIDLHEDRSLKIAMVPDSKSATFATQPGATLSISGKSGWKKSVSVPSSGIVKFPELPLDEYSVRVVRDGWHTEERTFTLEDDIALRIPLSEEFAELRVATAPGAKVELLQNGVIKYSGKADLSGVCAFARLRKGTYTLKLSKVDFLEQQCKIELTDSLRLDLPLSPVVKSFTIYAPAYSLVKIQQNGRILKEANVNGSGKLVFGELAVGRYEVFVSREGFQPVSRTISLTDNFSIRTSLKPLPASPGARTGKEPETLQTITRYGTVVVNLNAEERLLNYLKKNGVEVRFDDGAWEKVLHFPLEKRIAAGSVKIRLRAGALQPVSPEQTVVRHGERTDVVFVVFPIPSKVLFRSNVRDAEFHFRNRICRNGDSVMIEPFKRYSLTSTAEGFDPQKSIVEVDAPGSLKQVFVSFVRKEIPCQAELKKGISLLNAEEYEKALEILTLAGSAGNPEAAYQVAVIYEKGLGMWFSKKSKALEWYRKAAELGHAQSAFLIAEAIRNGDCDATEKEMLEFYLRAANRNHAQAAYQVAGFYEKGTSFLTANEKQALHYLRIAAELRHPEAMFELGLRYENGRGVPFSSDNAIQWYRKAASAGLEKAEKRAAVLEEMRQ